MTTVGPPLPGKILRLGLVGRDPLGLDAMRTSLGFELVGRVDPGATLEHSPQLPGVRAFSSLDDLLAQRLDGLIVATPGALRAEHALRALSRGLPVFCALPVGRSGVETRRVIEAAKTADRLLGLDLNLRHIPGISEMRALVRSGALGEVFAAQAVYHDARGPGRGDLEDVARGTGGCLSRLGAHMIDLLLYLLGTGGVIGIEGRCYSNGRRVVDTREAVEDFAAARLILARGTELSLACSWRQHIGENATISLQLFGERGGVALCNAEGSAHRFVVERRVANERQLLAGPTEVWRGRSLQAWMTQLAHNKRFDSASEQLFEVTRLIDAVYGTSG